MFCRWPDAAEDCLLGGTWMRTRTLRGRLPRGVAAVADRRVKTVLFESSVAEIAP